MDLPALVSRPLSGSTKRLRYPPRSRQLSLLCLGCGGCALVPHAGGLDGGECCRFREASISFCSACARAGWVYLCSPRALFVLQVRAPCRDGARCRGSRTRAAWYAPERQKCAGAGGDAIGYASAVARHVLFCRTNSHSHYCAASGWGVPTLCVTIDVP